MTELCISGAVVAQTNVYEHMGRRFRPGGNSFDVSDAVVWLLFIAGAVVLAWFLHKLVTLVTQTKKHSLNRLFGQLCVTHDVSWHGRRLLYRLAGVHGLPHPVHLFLCPDCFRPQTLPPEMSAFQSEVADLHATLFGCHEEGAAESRS